MPRKDISMNDRFSMNGDGKKPEPRERLSMNGDGEKPPDRDEREKQVIKALSGRYDELEALWEEAEKDLKRFRVPHEVHHRYKQFVETRNGLSWDYFLGFLRYGKDWRICHCVFCDRCDDEFEWKPVVECTVDVRLETVPHFAELRKKVVEAAEKFVPKLEKAIASFRETLKS